MASHSRRYQAYYEYFEENRLCKGIISKRIFWEAVAVGMDCTGSEQSPMTGFCEPDKETGVL
jgi:hypothetical protein